MPEKPSYEALEKMLADSRNEVQGLRDQIVDIVMANGSMEIDGKDVPLWPYSKIMKIKCKDPCKSVAGMIEEAPPGWIYTLTNGWACPACAKKWTLR